MPFCLFHFGVSLFNLHSRKKGTLIMHGLLGNLTKECASFSRLRTSRPPGKVHASTSGLRVEFIITTVKVISTRTILLYYCITTILLQFVIILLPYCYYSIAILQLFLYYYYIITGLHVKHGVAGGDSRSPRSLQGGSISGFLGSPNITGTFKGILRGCIGVYRAM